MGKAATWGTLGHLTEQQQTVLGELREAIQETSPDLLEGLKTPKNKILEDGNLLRYLRARDFNLKKSLKMLQEDLYWRSELDDVTFSAHADFEAGLAMHNDGLIKLVGKDKRNRPVTLLKPW